jgi:hypothetical protein
MTMMGLLKNNTEEPTIVLQCTSLPSRNQAVEVKTLGTLPFSATLISLIHNQFKIK